MKPFERPKTERNGEQWLPDHPWCPNGQIDYGISEVKREEEMTEVFKRVQNTSSGKSSVTLSTETQHSLTSGNSTDRCKARPTS